MATLTVFPDANPESTTVDGLVQESHFVGSGLTWASIRIAAGTSASDISTSPSLGFICDNVSGKFTTLRRAIFLFDTSALTSAANITSAVLSLYINAKADTNSYAPTIDIYTSTPASNTALIGTDFAQVGSTSQTGAPKSYASLITSAYNDFTLDATGISNVSKTGISKFGARERKYDADNTTPAWATGASTTINWASADTAGTTQDPKLVITYNTSFNYTESGTVSGVSVPSAAEIKLVADINTITSIGVVSAVQFANYLDAGIAHGISVISGFEGVVEVVTVTGTSTPSAVELSRYIDAQTILGLGVISGSEISGGLGIDPNTISGTAVISATERAHYLDSGIVAPVGGEALKYILIDELGITLQPKTTPRIRIGTDNLLLEIYDNHWVKI